MTVVILPFHSDNDDPIIIIIIVIHIYFASSVNNNGPVGQINVSIDCNVSNDDWFR